MSTADLPESVRELLAAISETLTVPDPGRDLVDMAQYEAHVSGRIHQVQNAIGDILGGDATLGIQWEADYLRKRAAEIPPTYRTVQQYIADLRRIAAGGEGQ